MKNRFLVDSNVLVYAYDRSEPEKQAMALKFLDQLLISRQGVLTVQVVAEFFVAVTKKLSAPLTIKEGYDRVKTYLCLWPILDLNRVCCP